eukprot:12253172-Heterocapsa_arctica.AAC.1
MTGPDDELDKVIKGLKTNMYLGKQWGRTSRGFLLRTAHQADRWTSTSRTFEGSGNAMHGNDHGMWRTA